MPAAFKSVFVQTHQRAGTASKLVKAMMYLSLSSLLSLALGEVQFVRDGRQL